MAGVYRKCGEKGLIGSKGRGMAQYFAMDYTGGAFVLYGTGHLTALAIITILCFSLPTLRNLSETARRNTRYLLAILMAAAELSVNVWNLYWGTWSLQNHLPLHLCGVALWGAVYMLFTDKYSVYEIIYFWGIGGATQALLTPDANQYGFPHYRAFQTFTVHGLLVIIPLYMTIVEGYRPTLQSLKRTFTWTNIYVAVVFVLNFIMGSNYLFIAHKPEFPTLIDALAPWPWYIFELEAIGLVIFSLLYVPFLIKDWRANRQTAAVSRHSEEKEKPV
jgi:hypothetical integral membrane protein (TIGR02206 family)